MNSTRLYLNIFRGEPAISQFDQPFTPTHTSSKQFSTYTGSDLLLILLRFHPGHGQLTRFRVYPIVLFALLRLAFAPALFFQNLTSHYRNNSLAHYARGTWSRVRIHRFHRLQTFGFRFYFTPLPGFFSPFPRGTRALSVIRQYLALPHGRGGFSRNFTCSVILGCTITIILIFRLRGCYTLWRPFPELFCYTLLIDTRLTSLDIVSHNPCITTHVSLHNTSLGYSQFAHHYYGNHFVFFSWRYLDVSVHAVHSFTLCIQIKVTWDHQVGFPHSEIFGSKFG